MEHKNIRFKNLNVELTENDKLRLKILDQVCAVCGVKKSLDQFYPKRRWDRASKDRQSLCIDCENIRVDLRCGNLS